MQLPLLPWAMRGANRIRHGWWRLTGATVHGVHGIALTPNGAIVLVKLTYAPGWRVPGGAKGRRETPQAGVLRELREEIGLAEWGRVEEIYSGEQNGQGWVERDTLFVIRDVTYKPRRSLEIAEAAEFELNALPSDLSTIAASMIATMIGAEAAQISANVPDH